MTARPASARRGATGAGRAEPSAARRTYRESELFEAIRDLCNMFELLLYHTYDSRRSVAGFPDLVIVGAGGVLYRELKTATGKVSGAQQDWLDALTAAGQDATVWRPVDLVNGRITRELRQLRRRAHATT